MASKAVGAAVRGLLTSSCRGRLKLGIGTAETASGWKSSQVQHLAFSSWPRPKTVNDISTRPIAWQRVYSKSTETESQGKKKDNGQDKNKKRYKADPAILAGVGIASVLLALSQPISTRLGPDEPVDGGGGHAISTDPGPTAGDNRDPSLPRYRLEDIRQHDANSEAPWVTSGDKVYDITDWVAAHPGGDVILRAAGGSIDPYWNIFTIHKAPHVHDILQQYLIGLIDWADLVDGQPAAENIEDPFADDPVRDPRLITHTAKPRNAEPPRHELDQDFTTPNELFYVRNHMWVPVVKEDVAAQHRLTIELPDGDVRTYTLEELQSRFPVHKVTAILQCSGNRRSDMTRSVGKTNGLQWGVGAISNAVWEGVLLRDVLADAGLKTAAGATTSTTSQPEDLHVHFSGLEAYAASIPLPVAMDPRGDVLLAFGMNGKPLPRDHGYPLRTIVPGHVAARSVKWLSRIVVADEESPSQWQRRDYKLFGPNEGSTASWDRYPAIQEMPITSAITGVWVGDECLRDAGKGWWKTERSEQPGWGARAVPGVRDPEAWQAENLAASTSVPVSASASTNTTSASTAASATEPIAVTGYAYSGGGREIVRVDVSIDGGRTWDQAELLDQSLGREDDDGNIVARAGRDWSWKRWRYAGRLVVSPTESCSEIIVKATDSAYNTQPEHHDGIYNVRGNLATAWHRVRVCPQLVQTSGSKQPNKMVWTTDKANLYGCGFGKQEK